MLFESITMHENSTKFEITKKFWAFFIADGELGDDEDDTKEKSAILKHMKVG